MGGALSSRIDDFERELDRVGSMSAAFAIMAGNGAGQGPNRLTVGLGLYGDKKAFAIGYGRQVTGSAAVNFGIARSGKKTMGGGSVGFSW
jgi:hypothetical protein